ncbi:MAG: DUF2147 domain-containing protein [Spirochaetaceae bacterium]|nr:DUF2147 domain-containing protein [Spirochaetaceae bacterium]
MTVKNLLSKTFHFPHTDLRKFCVFFLIFFAFPLFSAEKSDILGYWYGPEDKNGRSVVIRFFEEGDTFSAVAVAFVYKDEDDRAKNEALSVPADRINRAKALAEITKLYDMEYNNGEWRNGKIHNPVAKKDFTINIKLSPDLKTAYIRVSLDKYGIIGINTKWSREDPSLYSDIPDFSTPGY